MALALVTENMIQSYGFKSAPTIRTHIVLEEMIRAKTVCQLVSEERSKQNRPEVVAKVVDQLWKYRADDQDFQTLSLRRKTGKRLMHQFNATKWEVRQAIREVESAVDSANPHLIDITGRKEHKGDLIIKYAEAGDHTRLLLIIRSCRPEQRLLLVNKHDDKNNSPLHYAVYNNRTRCVQVLLSYLADPNWTKEPKQNSLLHWCCAMSHNDIAKLLIHSGADITQKNKQQKVCYELAPPGEVPTSRGFIQKAHKRYKDCMMRVLGMVPSLTQRAMYRIAFDKIDTDSNGVLDPGELRELMTNLLRETPSDEEFEMFLEWFDKDGDGQITFTEYMCGILKGFHGKRGVKDPLQLRMQRIIAKYAREDYNQEAADIVTQQYRLKSSDSIRAAIVDTSLADGTQW